MKSNKILRNKFNLMIESEISIHLKVLNKKIKKYNPIKNVNPKKY